MSDTWAWISGWAIQPDQFKGALEASLPDHEHVVFAPTATALDAALATGAARIGGYSLGSLLLLAGLERVPHDTAIYCLAPFTAFCEEHGMGGTTPVAALEMIQARLSRQPERALKLFYRLAGLKDEPLATLPYAVDDLAWGLDALKTIQAREVDLGRAIAILGTQDPLVRHERLDHRWKHIIQTDCQHDYRALLQALVRA